MNSNDLPFEQFFAEKIKERGVTLKKLAEMTGMSDVTADPASPGW